MSRPMKSMLPVVVEPSGVVEIEGGTPWPDVVEAFLNAAVDSPRTRDAYGRALRRAFTALRVRTLDELTGAKLAAYRAQLLATRAAPSTHAQALAALRSFLAWSGVLGAHGLSGDLVRMALRTPRVTVVRPYNVFTEADIAALFGAAVSARDRALLAVFLGGGLRIGEVAALDCRDLRSDAGGGLVLHVRQGKGRKDRLVPVGAEVEREIVAYLLETNRRPSSQGPLFRSYDAWHCAGVRYGATAPHRHLSTMAVFKAMKAIIARAGLDPERFSPHSARHSCAIRMLRAGASTVAVARVLGHSSITTTQRYLDHLELPELRAAIPKLPTGGTSGAGGGGEPKP
jgi:site-specific recombinase XerD